MPVTWEAPPEEVFQALALNYGSLIHQHVAIIASRRSREIEAWMKTNALWQDQTGAAREELFSDVINIVNEAVVIVMSHGVDYGVYLELSFGGRYAIIMPALDEFIPLIWSDVTTLLGA